MSRAFELQTNRSGKCLKAELKLARASRVPDKVANAMPTLGGAMTAWYSCRCTTASGYRVCC